MDQWRSVGAHSGASDEVWLGVLATRRGRDRDRRAHRLCRMLGFGLLAVTSSTGHVEMLAEPSPYRPRPNALRRAAASRAPAEAGRSDAGRHQPPARDDGLYRQAALRCAAALRDGPRRTRDLAPMVPDASRILLHNVYGWFERIARGTYRLTPLGEAAAAPARTDWAARG